ncbi:MAG: hypothetical protein ABI607_09690 [Betaproteobacteria bacterium]
MNQRHRGTGKQGGWVGLIVVLLALVIVAWLSKDALKQYGLLGEIEKQPRPAANSVRGPGVGATGVQPDVTTVTPAPLNALEKARGMQDTVREQAAEQSKRIDDAIK